MTSKVSIPALCYSDIAITVPPTQVVQIFWFWHAFNTNYDIKKQLIKLISTERNIYQTGATFSVLIYDFLLYGQ